MWLENEDQKSINNWLLTIVLPYFKKYHRFPFQKWESWVSKKEIFLNKFDFHKLKLDFNSLQYTIDNSVTRNTEPESHLIPTTLKKIFEYIPQLKPLHQDILNTLIEDKEDMVIRVLQAIEDLADMIDSNFSEIQNKIRQIMQERSNSFWLVELYEVKDLEKIIEEIDKQGLRIIEFRINQIHSLLLKIFKYDHNFQWTIRGFIEKAEKAVRDLDNEER